MSELKSSNSTYYHQSTDELLRDFDSDLERGLKSSELENRYQNFGYNELKD